MDREAFINEFITDGIKSDKHLKSKSLKCVFPCCNRMAVRSHTISQEDALRSISINGEVFTLRPKLKNHIRVFEPELVGISKASTFYGFCNEHEKLFKRIDSGLFETEYDLLLQLLRCVGWWKSVEFERNKLIKKHQKTLESFENEIFKKVGINKQSNNINSYDVGLDITDEMYLDLVKSIENDKKQHEQKQIVDGNVFKFGKWTILYKHLNFQIPLVLSSRHPFRMGTEIFSIHWSVIPHSKTTDIILLLDADGINKHIGHNTIEEAWLWRTKNDLFMLETVESAMVSSEFWYMKSDIYDRLSYNKKSNLEYDVRYKCIYSHVWDDIAYTIFEDLWVELIKDENDLNIINEAQEKMRFIPPVPTEEERKSAESKLSKAMFDIYHNP